jgi:hypothetical protein
MEKDKVAQFSDAVLDLFPAHRQFEQLGEEEKSKLFKTGVLIVCLHFKIFIRDHAVTSLVLM